MAIKAAVVAAAVVMAAGCHSWTLMQRNVFADDYGNVVTVDYGRSEREHVNTFVSPITGKEMEFKSKLLVKAQLPDGDSFKAWQCMNFQPRGTMYRTDNEKWMVLVNGFTCIIYARIDDGEYAEVFRGVLCDIDRDVKAEKNEKWKDVLWHGREYRRPAPLKK